MIKIGFQVICFDFEIQNLNIWFYLNVYLGVYTDKFHIRLTELAHNKKLCDVSFQNFIIV